MTLILAISSILLFFSGVGYFLAQRNERWGIAEFFLLFILWILVIGIGVEICPQRWKEISLPLGVFGGGCGVLAFLFFRSTMDTLAIRRFSQDNWIWILGVVLLQIIVSALWVFFCSALVGQIEKQTFVNEFIGAAPYERWAFVFIIIVWAPIIEELLVRSFFWRAILASPHQKIAITGLFFGFLHMDNLYSVPPLCVFGFLLGFLRYRSDSIWVPMCAHFLNNAIVLSNIALS